MAEIPDLPSNSAKSREKTVAPRKDDRPKLVSVVEEGSATQRKTPVGKRFIQSFGGDDARSVGNFILMDIVVPTVKDMISNVVGQGIDRALFGESGRRQGSGRTQHTSYSRVSDERRTSYSRAGDRDRDISRVSRSRFDFDDIVLPTRGEAEKVLDTMVEVWREYGSVRVADLYDLVGITSEYTDNNFGWVDMRNADVSRVRSGYVLDLPKPVQLDR
jgi:hypothetical protein